MPTTTNYGWTTPADTDLVKDGAAAIRTLGSSIDTTLKTQIDAQIPDSLLTTTGDVIYASAANTPARLGIGSSGQVLTVSGGIPSWATASGIPAGFVMMYAANSAPTGFLKANGAAVSRTTYATLFAAIGTTFGAGDGSTTFLLPDMRGYFTRNWADNGSTDSGRTFGSTQSATSVAVKSQPSAVAMQNTDGTDGTTTVAISDTIDNQSATYNKVRPVNIALLACIKF